MVGIYKITNKINGKCYIGQSKNIKIRWKNHHCNAFNPESKDYNNHLYRSIRKYGIENFTFEVLQECTIDELNTLERYYIEKFNSCFNGYNLTLGGDSSSVLPTDIIKNIINDLENTTLLEKEIAKKYNVHENTVISINTGQHWRINREYPIRKQKKAEKYYCVDCGKEISRKSNRCFKCSRIFRRETERPSREELKKLIRTIPFTQIAKQYNVTDNAIRSWCDAEDLPRRKIDIKKYTDEEWEKI